MIRVRARIPSKLNRPLALAAATLAAGVGLVVMAAPASAHPVSLVGTATCASDGTYSITYNGTLGQADIHPKATVTVTGSTPTGTDVSPASQTITAAKGAKTSPFTITQTKIPGSATTASLSILSVFTDDNFKQPTTATVKLDGTCTQAVTATQPSFTPGTCTAPNGSLVIPASDGAQYTVGTKSDGSDAKNVDAGTYPVTSGSTVYVKAVAKPGYSLTGTTSWSYTATAPTNCTTSVVTAKPDFTDGTCDVPAGSVIIPTDTGVQYAVDGKNVDAGTYPIAAGGTATVTATAKPGYTLTGDTSWTHTVTEPSNCNNPPPPPTTTPPTSPTTSTPPSGGVEPSSSTSNGVSPSDSTSIDAPPPGSNSGGGSNLADTGPSTPVGPAVGIGGILVLLGGVACWFARRRMIRG